MLPVPFCPPRILLFLIIAGSVSNDDAKLKYPDGWKSPKPYLRIVPQPK